MIKYASIKIYNVLIVKVRKDCFSLSLPLSPSNMPYFSRVKAGYLLKKEAKQLKASYSLISSLTWHISCQFSDPLFSLNSFEVMFIWSDICEPALVVLMFDIWIPHYDYSRLHPRRSQTGDHPCINCSCFIN